MALFRFRLAAVLRHRERLREEKQAELALVEIAQTQAVADIEKLQRTVDQPAVALATQAGLTLSAEDMAVMQQHSEAALHALTQIGERRNQLEQIERLLVEKRAALMQADQAVKSLELLRERQAEAHRRQEQSQEQQRLDEVGQGQHRQRSFS